MQTTFKVSVFAVTITLLLQVGYSTTCAECTVGCCDASRACAATRANCVYTTGIASSTTGEETATCKPADCSTGCCYQRTACGTADQCKSNSNSGQNTATTTTTTTGSDSTSQSTTGSTTTNTNTNANTNSATTSNVDKSSVFDYGKLGITECNQCPEYKCCDGSYQCVLNQNECVHSTGNIDTGLDTSQCVAEDCQYKCCVGNRCGDVHECGVATRIVILVCLSTLMFLILLIFIFIAFIPAKKSKKQREREYIDNDPRNVQEIQLSSGSNYRAHNEIRGTAYNESNFQPSNYSTGRQGYAVDTYEDQDDY